MTACATTGALSTATMARPFRRTVAGALLFTALSTTGLVVGPLLVRYGIDHGISAKDKGVLRNAVIAYLIVVACAYMASRQQYVLINRAGEGFLQALRIRVFDHIQRQSLAFFDRIKSGVLIARMTADVESMGELVQFGLLQLASAAMLIVFSLVLLFALSWQLALVGLLVLPIIVVASRKFQRDSNAAYLDVRENIGLARIQGLFMPLLQALIGFTFLLVLWVGGRQLLEGRISLGAFVMFNTYMGMLIWPMIAFGWVVNLMQRGTASLDRINQIIVVDDNLRLVGALNTHDLFQAKVI